MSAQEDLREKMFAEIEESYRRFLAEIDSLTEAEWLHPTDPAGWTIKDHVIHAAVWAGSMVAVIDKQPRWEGMGIPLEIWKTITVDYDKINDHIQQTHHEMPATEVKQAFVRAHQALIGKAQALTIAELELPYSHYQSYAENQTHPLHGYIKGNSAGHYDEHLAEIRAILGK